jgi:hypothetical protein
MQEFDIGLVHLNSPLSFNDYVQVLCVRCAKYQYRSYVEKEEMKKSKLFAFVEIGINHPTNQHSHNGLLPLSKSFLFCAVSPLPVPSPHVLL